MPELIAVVDDTEGTRFALRRTLERAGYSVLEGANGADALRISRELFPDLLVLDVHMPDALGPEIARELKADPGTAHIPILQVSASYTDDADRAFGLQSGADAYLTEPVENELLLATIRALLRTRRAEITLEQAVESRDEALSIVAHDVRNLLHSMRLRLRIELLRAQSRDADQSGVATLVGVLERDIGRVVRVMEALLQRTQIQAGKLTLNPRPLDLAAVVRETVERLREDASFSGSTITVHAPRPVLGRFDLVSVEQMVTNLVSNAVKYGAGKPIDVQAAVEESWAVLTVVDHGAGIPPAEQQRVFERFDRGRADPLPGSYGVGLWIVRKLVELHRGTVTLDSKASGSTFVIRLPI